MRLLLANFCSLARWALNAHRGTYVGCCDDGWQAKIDALLRKGM